MAPKQVRWVPDVARRLELARRRRRHTQEQAAMEIGTSRSSLAQWEQRRRVPAWWFQEELENYVGESLTEEDR